MLKLLKLFFRDSFRNKAFTILNILGLAIGLFAFIVIMLWVRDELAYDSYNDKADRIFRLNMFIRMNGDERTVAVGPAPLAAALAGEIPEVEKAVRMREYGNSYIRYGNNSYNEKRIVYADSTIFDIFSIPVIKGSPSASLAVPFSVAISETMAKKYFGTEDPLNKILKFDNKDNYEVTAVYRDIPQASHFHFDFIASINSHSEFSEDLWIKADFHTYVLLNKKSDPGVLEKKLPILVQKYVAPQVAQALGLKDEKLSETSKVWIKFSIQNVRDIHLVPGISLEFEPSGDIKYVYIFSLIAVFIILLACINFINLSTARSAARLKEVGIKKVFGTRRIYLSAQFMTESLLTVFFAHIIAVIIAEVSLPLFNNLSGKNLSIDYFSVNFIITVTGLIVFVSLIAGSYPAIYLSSFSPVDILKKEMISGRKKSNFRSILVTGQFTVSIILLSSTLILNRQMYYIQKKNLGYEKEQLLVINNTFLLGQSINNFMQQLSENPQILKVTKSGFLPSPSDRNYTSVFRDGVLSDNPLFCAKFDVDFNYIETFKMKMKSGRSFSKDFSTDSSAVILNEAAVKLLGMGNPIGEKIGILAGLDADNKLSLNIFTIIGVVEDFNFKSLHESVAALAMFINDSPGMITIRLRRDTEISGLISYLKSKWKENSPDQPFEFDFVSDTLNRQYKGEFRLGKILGIFTILAFLVSCFGLFGLALFASEQRKKEIGVRKVNGSGITGIILLLTSDFSKLIFISFVLACPVTWYFMNKWLESFPYHMNISIWIFLLTGIISYILAIASVSYLSYRAASVNPVDTLKIE